MRDAKCDAYRCVPLLEVEREVITCDDVYRTVFECKKAGRRIDMYTPPTLDNKIYSDNIKALRVHINKNGAKNNSEWYVDALNGIVEEVSDRNEARELVKRYKTRE